eukprot:12347_1
MASDLKDLLGDSVQDESGNSIDVDELSAENDAIGIYFSAHWCAPCRKFTPDLIAKYSSLRESGKKFEIVFSSSDGGENDFNEYFAEMPWTTIPFADRERREVLSKKFKVKGIPTLVIVDAKTGKKISDDGRSLIMDDTEGFPWRPKTFWDIMDGGSGDFVSKEGTVETSAVRGSGKVLGLYFSAHWCPPCRQFTPLLIETYTKLKDAGKDFEFIFCSSDNSEAEFSEYFATMPWMAVPFGDARKKALSARFGVSGIPALAMVDADSGDTINGAARMAVTGDPEGVNFPWYQKPFNMLTPGTAMCINTEPCLIMFPPAGSEEKFIAALEPVAKEMKELQSKEDFELSFFYTGAHPMGQEFRAKLEGIIPAEALIILLEVPERRYYASELTEDDIDESSVRDFVTAYRNGELESKVLGA